MIDKIRAIIKGKWILILIIIWFLIGLGLLCSYLEWNWQVLTGIATWVLASGVFFTFWQIMQARKSTNAQIAMDLFRELRSDRALETLRFIYSLKPEEDRQTLHTIDLHSIDYVLDRFDVLAVLVAEGFVDDKLAIDAYAGVPALRCWYQLHQYIWGVRDKRKYFGDNFEAFTNRCLEYFNENLIEVGFENPDVTDVTIEDLVRKLLDAKEEKDESKKKLYPRSLEEIKRDRKKRKMTR